MKWRPILFSGPLVRMILTCAKCGHVSVPFPCERCGSTEFVKTQTRRLVKHIPDLGEPADWCHKRDEAQFTKIVGDYCRYCPYGVPGDRLWVRETWWHGPQPDRVEYDADFDEAATEAARFGGARKRPSIHMPRWASRIPLEITGVRAEQLQEINEADVLAEGVPCTGRGERGPTYSASGPYDGIFSTYSPLLGFGHLWNSLNANRGYGWAANPWVWPIEFRRIAGEVLA